MRISDTVYLRNARSAWQPPDQPFAAIVVRIRQEATPGTSQVVDVLAFGFPGPVPIREFPAVPVNPSEEVKQIMILNGAPWVEDRAPEPGSAPAATAAKAGGAHAKAPAK